MMDSDKPSPETASEAAWPIHANVTIVVARNPIRFEATALWHDRFAAMGDQELAPNWLVLVTLHCAPAPIEMYANIRRCVPTGNGRYLIIAQPFGLGRDEKIAWQAALEYARKQAAPRYGLAVPR